jgi:hypothetical protein
MWNLINCFARQEEVFGSFEFGENVKNILERHFVG